MSKLAKVIGKLLVSGVLFYVLSRTIDVQQVYLHFSSLDVRYIPLIVLLLISNYVLSSFRWKKLLIFEHTETVSVRYLTKLYFIGAFFNNFMPTSIGGDVYKVMRLGTKIHSKANAFSATFMERFTGIIVLILISYVGLINVLHIVITLLPDYIEQNRSLTLIAEFFLFFGFWLAAAAGFIALRVLAKKIERLQRVYSSLLQYKGKHGVMLWALGTSVVVQLLAIFTQYFIFLALGVDVPLLFALFILPVITIASFFIPSLNGLGVQDTLYVGLFGMVGIAAAVSLSASITYHLFRLVISLVGGLLYVLDQGDREARL